MKELILSENQERYETKLNKFLWLDYLSLLDRAEEKGIVICKELLPENNGLKTFSEKAKLDPDFQLGYKPVLYPNQTQLSVDSFRFLDVIFQKNRKKKKTPSYAGRNNPKDISGFGIKLSLQGWFRFIDRPQCSMIKIEKQLKSGKTIEEIFKPPRRGDVELDGKILNQKQLCEKLGINYRTYRNVLSRKKQDLISSGQKFNDREINLSTATEMAKKMPYQRKRKPTKRKPTKEKEVSFESGWMYKWERHWALLSEDDFCKIVKPNQSCENTLHEIISFWFKNKGE